MAGGLAVLDSGCMMKIVFWILEPFCLFVFAGGKLCPLMVNELKLAKVLVVMVDDRLTIGVNDVW